MDGSQRVLSEPFAGRYTIERVLGRGATATVYAARDLRDGSSVAIKVLRRELAESLGAERFLREVRVTGKMHHPRIVPVLDSGQHAGDLYFVSPLMEAGTLRMRLNREPQLAIADAVAITCAIAEALEYAHAQGLIHRDVKPENILFSSDGQACLSDFGIARAIERASDDASTSTGIARGTPAYMSPEQASGSQRYDGRTDIYSLACVLYEMIAGMKPFIGPTPEAVIAQRFMHAPRALRVYRQGVPPVLAAAIERAMQLVPADRYRTPAEFADALLLAQRGGAQVPDGKSASRATRATSRRRRLQFAAIVAAGTTVLLAGMWGRSMFSPSGATATVGHVERHIAVLYFDDLTPDSRLSHVAAGLTENLIDQLSQVRSLHVISPNGVRPFRNSVVPLDTIARQLNAGTLIGGSVSASGAMLRLTVRLIDGTTGQQLHVRTFERPSWDFFRLQDSLTTDVAFALRERIGGEIRTREQRSNASSVEAWQMLHRGEELSREIAALIPRGDSRALILIRQADSLYSLAERLDPAWVAPSVNRARNAYVLGVAQASDQRPENMTASRRSLQRAVALANRALVKEANNAEAMTIRGESRLRLVTLAGASEPDSLMSLAERDLRAAADARTDLAHTWYALGDLYLDRGRHAEAAEAYKSAYDADAFLAEIRLVLQGLIFANLNASKFDEAQRWCRNARIRYRDDPRFAECALTVLGWSGRSRKDIAEAWRSLKEIEALDSSGVLATTAPFRRMMVAAVIARTGLRDSAAVVVAQANKNRGDKPPALAAEAYVRLLMGQKSEAIELLEKVVSSAPFARDEIGQSPWFRQLQDEPRFRALLQRRM